MTHLIEETYKSIAIILLLLCQVHIDQAWEIAIKSNQRIKWRFII